MSSSRPSANIPLHSLSHRRYESASDDDDDASLLGSDSEKGRASSESDFSLFSETGDLADQLDDQDPLHIRLRRSLEQELPRGHRRKTPANSSSNRHPHHKSVRYHAEIDIYSEKPARPRLRKEDIVIPQPPRRPLSFGHRLLAATMAPGDGPSRIHGLHGKKLMYVSVPLAHPCDLERNSPIPLSHIC
jgi:hypothetical protein